MTAEQREEIIKALKIFKNPGELFEIRAIFPNNKIYSGIYDNFEEASDDVLNLVDHEAKGTYFIFNEINKSGKKAGHGLAPSSKTTRDADIITRRWILLDIDPDHGAGTNATDEEKADALKVLNKSLLFLRMAGFPEPVKVDSGNGYHAYFKVNLPNDTESRQLVKDFLYVLDGKFSGKAKVDTGVFNSSRISKLPGTHTRKGLNTAERPQRISRIISVPEKIELVTPDAIKAVAQLSSSGKKDYQKKKGHRKVIIEEFNKKYLASEVLNWYCQREGERFISPNSKSQTPGIVILDNGRFYSHHDSDNLDPDHSNSPYDAMLEYGYSGNDEKALEKAAELLKMQLIKKSAEEKPQLTPEKKEEILKDFSEKNESGLTPVTFLQEQVRDTAATVLSELHRHNNPPSIFTRHNQLVRVIRGREGRPTVEQLTRTHMRYKMERSVDWVAIRKNGKELTAVPDVCPWPVVDDLLSMPPDEWPFPNLKGISEVPIFHPDGSIHTVQGYDPESEYYFCPEEGFTMPDIPENPTEEDVKKSVGFYKDLFTDFPFVDECSRTNVIAAVFTAVLRKYVGEICPAFVVDKPQAGTGASLLQKIVGIIATGDIPASRNFGETEELRKEIFTALRDGDNIIFFDNLSRTISAGILAKELTSPEIGGRILGKSENMKLKNDAFWMLNGNNVAIGGDLARRIWISKIDAKVAIPWQRTGFKHENINEYILQNRGTALAAVYTIARAWVKAGCPTPKKIPKVGSFEKWRDIIGGIVEFSGLKDFMKNSDAVYFEADSELEEWEDFLSFLHKRFDEPWTVAKIIDDLKADHAEKQSLEIIHHLPTEMADAWASKKSASSRSIAKELRKQKDRRWPGGWILRESGLTTDNKKHWFVEHNGPQTKIF
ncbi:hypothetical protein [Methanoplanus endosymbiosus]|uniref:DNA primase/polymerase bifunctional N-terminal domain-containing protein n=1 Tax=Methanoplanus endosymbiosus TaxID=33865 RepID=A0A9E7PMY5_9EURY|nr:hypothetical protein [Methanoplanus endosymbiosus]UUX93230.1 hypothetical protein L6E24_03655 [Methanoplanus endosymbiosus]